VAEDTAEGPSRRRARLAGRLFGARRDAGSRTEADVGSRAEADAQPISGAPGSATPGAAAEPPPALLMRDASGWTDGHCHLQDDDEPVSVLERAFAAGIDKVVCVGTDVTDSSTAVEIVEMVRRADLAGRVPDLAATIGLHPHNAKEGVQGIVSLVESLAAGVGGLQGAGVVGIGECGLDYHYDHTPWPVQQAAFEAQIELARQHDLALVIHVRDAWDPLFELLEQTRVPERTILHCFTGGELEARRCLELGMYLSFSGIVTFKNAGEIRGAAELCPADRLLIETDSPYLTPVPHRGRPNEPAYVRLVGEHLARLRGTEPAELARQTKANLERVFSLGGTDRDGGAPTR
jgi:TatD DNase family protein